MRPAIRTKRQARQRLAVAFNITGDVLNALRRPLKALSLPDTCIHEVALSRSHLRAALAALNGNGNTSGK